ATTTPDEKVTTPEPEKAAVVKAEPAVVPAVAAEPGTPAPSMMELANAIPSGEFGNNLPRIVSASGKIKVSGDNTILGEHMDIQLLSSNDRWMVTPVADQKDKEAKKFCRASYDGKTIPDRDNPDGEGQLIEEYTDGCKKYDEFKVSKYLDLFCLVVSTGDPDMTAKAQGLGLVQVSISPTAIGPYMSFARQGNLTVMRGLMTSDKRNCFRIRAEARSSDTSDWTVFVFEPTPLEELADYTPVTL
ncbi:MAG: hypothetical protein ABFR50_12450, partial [Candidatus Fermentibacteria bacterium]